MMKQLTLPLLILSILLSGCNDTSDDKKTNEPEPEPETRSFFLGFTPWPYEATVDAVTSTYSLIQDHGDIVAHHLMDGVPWNSAFNNTALSTNIEDDVTSRKNQTINGKEIYLAIDSLNTARDDLAPNWGTNGSEARPAPWNERDFDSLEVAQAYSNFALEMIDRFDPAYFNYGTEVSELMLNDATRFDNFAIFAERVYDNIKAEHPNLPLMVSIALKSPDSANATTIANKFSKIADYVDVLGISVYPYAFYDHTDKGDPANMPSNWLSQASTIAAGKPMAITETGWIAENLKIDGFGFDEQSDVTKQRDYVSELMKNAKNLSLEFIIWFTVVDYDALWNDTLGQDDLSKIWKDTGLYDGNINARPALDVWNKYYAMDKEE